MNELIKMAKEAREASFDIAVESLMIYAVESLMIYAEAIGYKAEEPEECVRWELAKAFYKEFKKEVEYDRPANS